MRRRKLVLLVFIAALMSLPIAAEDLRAVAEDGRKVLLAPDGKWRFDTSAATAVPASSAASPYQSSVKRFSVSFDTAEWTLEPVRDGDEGGRRSFRHRTLPLHAAVLSDEVPATTTVMKDVVLSNARAAANAPPTILVDQLQVVNGKEVGSLRIAAPVKAIDFVYSSYYYADADGNIQVHCWTAQSLFFKYQNDCQKFLNGLTIK